MSFTVYARMKKIGKQKREDLSPIPFVLEKKPETLRELLTLLTRLLVKEYNARKDEGQTLLFLTKEEIREQAGRGKITFGLRGGADASEEDAVENAIQCFTDGIYRVFAGEEELTELEAPIGWKEDLVFTLISLTMLSGW